MENANLDLCQGYILLALYFSFSCVKVGLIFTQSIIACGALSYHKKKKKQPSIKVPLKDCNGSGFSALFEQCALEVWARTPITTENRIGSHSASTVHSG